MEGPENLRSTLLSASDRLLRAALLDEEVALERPIRGGATPVSKIDPAAYYRWVRGWRGVTGPEIIFGERATRDFGRLIVPERAIFRDMAQLAEFAGFTETYVNLKRRFDKISRMGGNKREIISKRKDILALTEQEMGAITQLVEWRIENPRKEIWPRELNISGVDTKWVEGRLGLVQAFYSAFDLLAEGATPAERCGFLSEGEALLGCRAHPDDFAVCEFSFKPASFLRRPEGVTRLFVVENRTTFKTLSLDPGTMIIRGDGYASTGLLKLIPWLGEAEITYWGDCDGHGYRILNAIRAFAPHTISVGMDEAHVLENISLAVAEPETARINTELSRLTPEEAAGRDAVAGRGLRLEQEKTPLPQGA